MHSSNGSSPDFVLVGKIGKPHGVRGRLRLFTEDAQSDALEWSKSLWLLGPQPPHRRFELVESQPAERFWIVTLKGVSSRELAAELTNFEVYVERSALPELEDEYYVHDLIGLHVVNETGTRLGTVVEVFDNGAHDVLVYQPAPSDDDAASGETIMVPFVSAFVGEVDFEAKTIELLPYEVD